MTMSHNCSDKITLPKISIDRNGEWGLHHLVYRLILIERGCCFDKQFREKDTVSSSNDTVTMFIIGNIIL